MVVTLKSYKMISIDKMARILIWAVIIWSRMGSHSITGAPSLEVGNVHVFPLSLLLHLLHEPVVVDVPGGDLEAGEGGHPRNYQPHCLFSKLDSLRAE